MVNISGYDCRTQNSRSVAEDGNAISSYSGTLTTRLAEYSAAAGATAAGLLLMAIQADARVIYTPANITIGNQQALYIDVDNDGITDFGVKDADIFVQGAGLTCDSLTVKGKHGGNIVESSGSLGYAARLPFRAVIGPKRGFRNSLVMGYSGAPVVTCSLRRGPWEAFGHPVEGFLGLQFPIRGELHYGWAAFTVSSGDGATATLTGYAYETVPGKGLKAGQTHNTDSITDSNDVGQMRPSTLGALAAGARGLDVWRREEDAMH
jgi:hypothetical protein